MVYGTEAIIPVEIGELRWRTANPKPPKENNQVVREEQDLVEELHTQAALREVLIKQRTVARYNARFVFREFTVGELVFRREDVILKNATQGKLAPKWEGPYRVISKIGKGAYQLKTMNRGDSQDL